MLDAELNTRPAVTYLARIRNRPASVDERKSLDEAHASGHGALPAGEPVKELEADFPGIRRTLHESYVRYSFERFGVPYVAAIYCRDTRPRPKLRSG